MIRFERAKGRCVAKPEIALPVRVAGVGFGHALSGSEAVEIGFQRGFQVTALSPDATKADDTSRAGSA